VLVGVEERMKDVVASGERPHLVMPLEGAHDGQAVKDFGEDVVVGGRGGRLGVVLGDVDLTPLPGLARAEERGAGG
jgi:hypothetical protein